jgi:hypothetical protein
MNPWNRRPLFFRKLEVHSSCAINKGVCVPFVSDSSEAMTKLLLRRSIWRSWVVALLVLSYFGLYELAATHHHHSAAEEDSCEICQVVNHLPVDLGLTPVATLAAIFLILFFTEPRVYSPPHFVRLDYPRYHSQAPPRHSVA